MGQSNQSAWDYGSSAPPSVYGALPYGAPAGHDLGGPLCLTFAAFSPTILHSVLIDAKANIHYRVESNSSPIFTFIKDSRGRSVAIIEWRSHPTIEIRGVAPKQSIQNWLGLSRDGLSRIMTVGNRQYAWAPNGRHICLYATSSAAPQPLVTVSKTQATVTLEVTPRALELGLLEPSIVATVLLQSGRNID
ncbi:hypothetical protein GLOTRDRAFT_47436 [Gloeophyllum trabeum ATCC 11539]|uniref:DUF6593 domain-containing protein n=1 Tax=Gloeophyllum trabeum (strain ATCC 11539 / FP-39264 / Madison 617) TaxID=670483 RepID=S7PY29_GLOTA|nr:uncharacterized protein GLOTRDRAFT_47436 [Gloeophyllum trabeum ATCC 11539]EPQ52257.1 hypothetical protein GLOTRDRAFT_47436 [Gloeophyllum trabeum ATCC 11539]